jgi:hypothetical protein
MSEMTWRLFVHSPANFLGYTVFPRLTGSPMTPPLATGLHVRNYRGDRINEYSVNRSAAAQNRKLGNALRPFSDIFSLFHYEYAITYLNVATMIAARSASGCALSSAQAAVSHSPCFTPLTRQSHQDCAACSRAHSSLAVFQ